MKRIPNPHQSNHLIPIQETPHQPSHQLPAQRMLLLPQQLMGITVWCLQPRSLPRVPSHRPLHPPHFKTHPSTHQHLNSGHEHRQGPTLKTKVNVVTSMKIKSKYPTLPPLPLSRRKQALSRRKSVAVGRNAIMASSLRVAVSQEGQR
jgi:hypothetical protein